MISQADKDNVDETYHIHLLHLVLTYLCVVKFLQLVRTKDIKKKINKNGVCANGWKYIYQNIETGKHYMHISEVILILQYTKSCFRLFVINIILLIIK